MKTCALVAALWMCAACGGSAASSETAPTASDANRLDAQSAPVADASEWRRVTPPGASYSIEIPGTTDEDMNALLLPGRRETRYHMSRASHRVMYLFQQLGRHDVSTDELRAQFWERTVSASRGRFQSESTMTLLSESDVEIPGARCHEFVIGERHGGKESIGRFRIYLADSGVGVSIAAVADRELADQVRPDQERFFNSLTFIPAASQGQ